MCKVEVPQVPCKVEVPDVRESVNPEWCSDDNSEKNGIDIAIIFNYGTKISTKSVRGCGEHLHDGKHHNSLMCGTRNIFGMLRGPAKHFR